ncbi:MAG: ABC transporter ATP-binding protein [Siculibacillus sp.]|nr:ABC transporter ATP-binding protein [Siculibacillus sp.]
MPEARPSAPRIVFENVSKTFANGVRALADVSLVVAPGEFVSLLGPSGCGKTTLLRIAAGLEIPDAGRLDRPDREVGFVFQDPTLMPWASVADNVALPLRFARLDEREIAPRVMEALARVGLATVAGAFPRELSGGMRMRASIARALVTRPRILLFDEPFAALDEIGRFALDRELHELSARERLTVIFVTHSVYEAVFLSSRVVVMAANPGRIVGETSIAFAGPRDETLRDRAEFTAACSEVSAKLRDAMTAPSTVDRAGTKD